VSAVTDEIKARVDLVELIGRSVALRKSGSSFKGLCPFHQEKTPSFYVFPASHTWVCFGCDKKGTAFDWLMEREHIEFSEALRTLAQMAGVELRDQRDDRADEAMERLYAALAAAQTFYRGMLEGAAGAAARRYLAERGVNDETSAAFGLGYAPGGNQLLRYLSEAGYSPDELEASGLISTSDDGRRFDFFRDRLLFPIRDARGRTLAFGGRVLGGDHQPKYLNSRDTLLFHKQETLFGLDLARRAIAQTRRAVIVEGYMDAVIAHQYGHRNVVATLGTAVTDRHLRQLRRLVDQVVLALDSDAAGQAATWRALAVAQDSLHVGVTPVVGPNRRQRRFVPDTSVRLRVLALPGAKDPDELIRASPEQWPGLVQAASPVIDFVLAQLGSRHDLSSAEGKAAAADEMSEVLARVADPIEQTHYVQHVAELLKVAEAAVWQALRRKQRGQRPMPSTRPGSDQGERADQGETDPLDVEALALVLHTRRHQAAGPGPWAPAPEHLTLPQSRALLQLLTEEPAPNGGLHDRVPAALRPLLAAVEGRLPVVERLSAKDLTCALVEVEYGLSKRAELARYRQARALLHEAPEDGEAARLLDEALRRLRIIEQRRESPGPERPEELKAS
jgi:DNA primase